MAKTSVIKDVRLFQSLEQNQLSVIESKGELRSYKIGDTVFNQGDSGTHLYCIINGRIEISMTMGETNEHAPVHVATSGSIFGEFVLFENKTRSAAARATKPTEIFAITADHLREIFQKDPTSGYLVMDNLCRILVGRMGKTTKALRSSLMW